MYSESYGYAPNGNLASKASAAYTYADAAHVHAVTHVGGAPRACYDAVGNQTVRLVGDTLHVLAYDAENRLTSVSQRSKLAAVIGRSGTNVTLSWPGVSGATAYEVWRGTTPYFTPGASGSVKVTTTTATSYSDPGRIGDPATNYYYLIIATANNCPLGVSQRIGEFDFALTPGALAGLAAVRAFEAEVEAQAEALNLNLNLNVELVDTPIASFAYDADGQRISATVNGVTTVYPFPHYEVEGATVHKYYFLAGQRVAMRTNGALSYLFSDHLGSLSVSTDGGAVQTGAAGYLPYGGTRYTVGALPTAYRFTGQERYANIGLDYFGARWYDSALGRFLSTDTLVPSPGNPQSLNRYVYGLNNPLRYTDPTGHCGPLTPVCLGLLLGGMAFLLQGDSPDLNVTPEDVASQRLGGALVVGGTTLAAGGALVGTVGAARAGTTAVAATCADGDCTNEIRATTRTGEWINKEIAQGGNVLQRWGARTGTGPLPEKIANTFRSASYSEVKLTEEITLYRSYGGKAGELGLFWTRMQPSGPMQAQMDGAVLPEWGNTMTRMTQIRVPAGTVIYEGYAAEQAGTVIKLLGGGSQVYIPYVDPSWLIK